MDTCQFQDFIHQDTLLRHKFASSLLLKRRVANSILNVVFSSGFAEATTAQEADDSEGQYHWEGGSDSDLSDMEDNEVSDRLEYETQQPSCEDGTGPSIPSGRTKKIVNICDTP
jgi:hypothetical protein